MLLFDICFSLDDNYSEQLAVAITSIIKNSKDDEIFNFYVLDGGISDHNKTRILNLKKIKNFNIKFIEMNYDDFETCPMLKEYNEQYQDYHTTKPTYFRFQLPSLLPELDKLLYLDCDIVVSDSLKTLYETDIEGYYAAMVADVDNKIEMTRLNLPEYYNAGVMLINLAQWRKDDIQNKLFEYCEKNKEQLLWQDQDVINLFFNNKILKLPDKWNFQIAKGDFEDAQLVFKNCKEKVVLHFAGRYKPWLNLLDSPIFEIYYSYLYLIPWLDNIYTYKNQWFNLKLKQNLFEGLITEEFDKSYNYVKSVKKDLLGTIHVKFTELKQNLFEDIITEEFKKSYNYIELVKEDLLGIMNIKFSNLDKIYFAEQSKLYEYINACVSSMLAEQNKKIEELEQKIKNKVSDPI